MIKGNKARELTAKEILRLISSYDIYRMYVKRDFESGEPMLSPFRDEDHASFAITYSREGEWLHDDYGDSRFRGNCFQFIQQLFGITYNQALEMIDYDFQLGFRAKRGNYAKIIESYVHPTVNTRRETVIQVKVRKWKKEELDYWRLYKLEKEDLNQKDFQVYVPQEVWINRILYPTRNKLVFCYLFQNKWWKIYSPYADKKDKWKQNVPNDQMYGLSSISNCKKAIVTKSVKDLLSLQKLYPCIAGCQNESQYAINDWNIEYLRKNAQEIYIAFDSDVTGKMNSWYYTEHYGFKHLNTPDYLLAEGVKDFSGWIALEGVDVVNKFLIKKGIL